jgi:aryl-alcohol dehydrogenase-like predicted oxidoreductase
MRGPIEEDESSQGDRRGYVRAVRDAGTEPGPAWLVRGPDTLAGDARTVAHLLGRPGPAPTAIQLYNDPTAIGALHRRRAAGWRCRAGTTSGGGATVRLRSLGNTGLKVSELCLGTWTMRDQAEADAMVGMALDAGVNSVDTADVYGQGNKEEWLGRALGARRHEVVLTTKVYGRVGTKPNDLGLSRHHILEACEASLRRLGTDHVDLYLMHGFDVDTRVEESLRAFDDLVRAAKVRYVGCSNFAAWQLVKALGLAERRGWARPVALQAYYSLLCRDLELDLIPACLDAGLGVMVWSPLSGGFLSGKYRRGASMPEGRAAQESTRAFYGIDEEGAFAVVDALDEIGRGHDASVAQVALGYLLRKPGVTSVVVGARTREQLADNLGAAGLALTDGEMARLDALTPPPRVYPHWLPRGD